MSEGGVELLATDVVDVDGERTVLLVPAGEDLVDVFGLRVVAQLRDGRIGV